jgi:predicted transposase/invertase (TIGR01784 family)
MMEAFMSAIFFPDSVTILNPCKDTVFKLIFTRETPSSRTALSSLVSALIARKTQVIAVTANEPPAAHPQDRQIRGTLTGPFDIACKLEGNERANLEMTLYPKPYEAARLEYYLARLYANQDIKGVTKSFDDLKPAYQLSLFAGENLYPGHDLVHRFRYYDPGLHVSLGGRTELITLELKKAEALLGKAIGELDIVERWALFFRYAPDRERRELINAILAEEEGIGMAGEELLTVSEDERQQAWLMSAEKYDLDRQSDLTDARRAGRTEGLTVGRAEGRVEGYKEAELEYQGQIRQDQEQIRQLEEEIRRLRGG